MHSVFCVSPQAMRCAGPLLSDSRYARLRIYSLESYMASTALKVFVVFDLQGIAIATISKVKMETKRVH